MRMKLTHITPVLAAGVAALATAVAPTAAADPAVAQMANPSTVTASQVVPAAFHGGGGFHGGFHDDRGGWGWHPWGWPWGWYPH